MRKTISAALEVEMAGQLIEASLSTFTTLFDQVGRRFLDIDAEAALKAGTKKFERRFRLMEEAAGDQFAALKLDEKEALWQQAKRSEDGQK